MLRYVTGLLQVSFKAPTPMGGPLTLRAWPVEVGERKVVVDAEVIADGAVTVTVGAGCCEGAAAVVYGEVWAGPDQGGIGGGAGVPVP